MTVTALNSVGTASATSASVGPVAAAGAFDESKRSSINVNSLENVWSYALIDHLKNGDDWFSPTGAAWRTRNFTQSVDANGWPNKDDAGGTTGVSTQSTGGGFRIPASTDFNGAYVLEWTGNGTVAFQNRGVAITWTVDNTTALGNTTSTYTRVGDNFTNVSGQNAVVVIKPSGTNGPCIQGCFLVSSGPTPFATNLRFYRFEDRADLLAGNIFRRPWKQIFINLNPRHVRLLDWMGANSSNVMRFEHRNKPSYASYTVNHSGLGQPKYGVTTTPTSNQYVLDPGGVSGMPGGVGGAYQHGEQVTCRIHAQATNTGYTLMYIAGINQASDATVTIDTFLTCQHVFLAATSLTWASGTVTVTVSGGHGYTTGMVLNLQMANCNVAGYNSPTGLSDTCTITSSTQFTYARVTNPGSSATFSYVRGPAIVSGITWSGGIATVTTVNGLLFTVGSVIPMLIEGASPAGYNGEFQCTVVSANTFTYAVTNPGSASTRGAISSHGRPNGEKIVLIMSGTINNDSAQGMTQMDRRVATAANGTGRTFQTGINSSTFSTFTTGYACNNLTLDVGGRGPRAVVLPDGNSAVLKYNSNTIGWVSVNATFTYDAVIRPNTGTAGGWMIDSDAKPVYAGVPPEVAAALINELMAMSPVNPIHLYLTMPTAGLCSLDPDYTTASNFAANYLDIVVNPASTQRAAGFSAIDSRCNVYVEHSNETWNFGPLSIACYWQAWRSYITLGSVNGFQYSVYSTIRAVQTVRDCKALLPPASFPQIKYVLGMFSTQGATGQNDYRLNGSFSEYAVAFPGGHTPLFEFDHAAFAGYFTNDNSVPTYSLDTAITNWQAAIPNAAAMETTYATYLSGVQFVARGGAETIEAYMGFAYNKLNGTFGVAPACVAQGKSVIGYEGGLQFTYPQAPPSFGDTFYDNRANFTNGSTLASALGDNAVIPPGTYIIGPGVPPFTTVVSSTGGSPSTMTMSASFTGTTGQNYFVALSPRGYFMALCRTSTSWKSIHRTWFDGATAIAGSYAPAEFLIVQVGSANWQHTFGRDSYLAGNEAGGLDPDIIEQGNRNRGL